MPASASWSRIAALHKPTRRSSPPPPAGDRGGRGATPPPGRNRGSLAHGRLHPLGVVASAARLQGASRAPSRTPAMRDRRAPAALDAAAAEPHWAWLLEALFVAVYSFDVVLKAAYMGWPAYLKKGWHRALVALVCLFAAELAERGARRALGIPGGLLAHLARPLRPAVFCVRSRLVRRLAVDCLACLRTLGRLGALLPLLLFFATLAVRLFRARRRTHSSARRRRAALSLHPAHDDQPARDLRRRPRRLARTRRLRRRLRRERLVPPDEPGAALIYQSYCASHLKQDEGAAEGARGLGRPSPLLLPTTPRSPWRPSSACSAGSTQGSARLRVAAIVQTLTAAAARRRHLTAAATAASPYRRPLADPPPPAPGGLVPADGVSAAAFLLPRAADGPPAAPALPRAVGAAPRAREPLCGMAPAAPSPPRPPRPRGGGAPRGARRCRRHAAARAHHRRRRAAHRRWTHCWRRGRRWLRCSAGCCGHRVGRLDHHKAAGRHWGQGALVGLAIVGRFVPSTAAALAGCSARCARARCARNRGGGWRARLAASPRRLSYSASKSL